MDDIEYCECPKRFEIIQLFIDQIGARRYLEIGVASGKCFFKVDCAERIGVDLKEPSALKHPISEGAQYFQASSDDFFVEIAPEVLSTGIDVAFVDGFHSYRQALTDIQNCLFYLRPGGCIIIHDCSPQSAAEEQPLSAARARQYEGPWTGDTWKAITHLRATRGDLFIRTINCDAGCAVIFEAEHDQPLIEIEISTLSSMTYADLDRQRSRLLGLVAANEIDQLLAVHDSATKQALV